MLPKSGFFSDDEARLHEAVRRDWLEAERRSAANQIRQRAAEVSSDCGIKTGPIATGLDSNLLGTVQNSRGDGRVLKSEAVDQAKQEKFQNPRLGRRVFQYLKLFFVHRKSPLPQSGDGSEQGDSFKANSSKREAA